MNNKVLIILNVPEIQESYDIYLPVNKKIGNINILLNKAINSLSHGAFKLSDTNRLYNAKTEKMYDPNELVINTDIRNGTQLVLLS